jgi:hypothetical protein
MFNVPLIHQPEENVVRNTFVSQVRERERVGGGRTLPILSFPVGEEELNVGNKEGDQLAGIGAVKLLTARQKVHGQLSCYFVDNVDRTPIAERP